MEYNTVILHIERYDDLKLKEEKLRKLSLNKTTSILDEGRYFDLISTEKAVNLLQEKIERLKLEITVLESDKLEAKSNKKNKQKWWNGF